MNIFVSAAHSDVDAARELLRDTVCPALSETALKEYGMKVGMTDRFQGLGANENAVRVVTARLEAVREVVPPMPMVILLGDRLDPPLPPEAISFAEKEFSFLTQNKRAGMTELEIEYGALSEDERRRRAVVCLFSREDAKPEPAMQAIRRRLAEQIPPERILRFVCNEQGVLGEEDQIPFEKKMREVLWKQISTYPPVGELAQDAAVHRAYMEKKAAGFRSRQKAFSACMTAVIAETPTLFLTGKTGAGKSAVLSRLLVELREEPMDYRVLPIYCGLTEDVDTGMEVLMRIVRYLENALGKRHIVPESFDAWKDYEEQLCIEYEGKADRPLMIGIDGVDQLRASKIARELLFLPYGKYQKVRFAVSLTPEIAVPRRYSKSCVIELDLIEEAELREIIRGILTESGGEEPSQELEDLLTDISRKHGPLVLNQVVMALKVQDLTARWLGEPVLSGGDLDRVRLEIIKKLTEQRVETLTLCRRVLTFACERIDARLLTALTHIAAAPYGFTTEMLQTLGGKDFDVDNFRLLRHCLQEIFVLRADGRHDFTRKYFRQSLHFVGLNGRADDPALSRRIFEALYRLEDTDPSRVDNILSFAWQSGQCLFAIEYIINAFWDGRVQHRRRAILRLLKEKEFCRMLIDHLPAMIARGYEQASDEKAGLSEHLRLLHRFCNIFGPLFDREGEDHREDVLEREEIYGRFMYASHHSFAQAQERLLKYRDEMEFMAFPFWGILRDWYANAARYQKLYREKALFVSGAVPMHMFSDTAGITQSILEPLSEKDAEMYNAMDRKAFRDRAFELPYITFCDCLRLWLHTDGHGGLERWFEDTHIAEVYFIRVFSSVLTEILRHPGYDQSNLENAQALYEKARARALEIHAVMLPWERFVKRVKFSRLPPPKFDSPEAAYRSFVRRYRDLEYRESSGKYRNFFNAARGAVEMLTENHTEKAIACCHDAVNAAERALRFTDGRSDFVSAYFEFAEKQMRQLLRAGARCAVEQEYEHQLDFLLDEEISFPRTVYTHLLRLDYAAALEEAYQDAATAEQVERWHRGQLRVVCRFFRETEEGDDWWEEMLPPQTTRRQALLFLMDTVETALRSLYTLAILVDGFDADEAPETFYADLESAVLYCFDNGSTLYVGTELEDTITAMRKQVLPANFMALLERLDKALSPF